MENSQLCDWIDSAFPLSSGNLTSDAHSSETCLLTNFLDDDCQQNHHEHPQELGAIQSSLQSGGVDINGHSKRQRRVTATSGTTSSSVYRMHNSSTSPEDVIEGRNERRRERNRLAARKSREKRLSYIAELEGQVERYRHEVAMLSLKLQSTQQDLLFTRQQLQMVHSQNGHS
ncbi:hypothetical protein MIR68_012429 [Amoeboaphelidium protococcarum]|nr:hypothetical protein MIR68_012429 [Amoeboaphelidium protococcarum]KAI3652064.1 hypothetical protein MP228_003367 [Amoeboaphelidium protococcarum]